MPWTGPTLEPGLVAGTQKKDTDSEPRLGINITVKFDFLSEVDIDWFVSLKEIL